MLLLWQLLFIFDSPLKEQRVLSCNLLKVSPNDTFPFSLLILLFLQQRQSDVD
jgi:hypothetical protein